MSGTKQYEFRKQIFRDRSKHMVFIYASSPVKKIVGCFRLNEIVEGHPDYLWEQFCDVSGISEQEFFDYFASRDNGYAIRIDNFESFNEPVDPYIMFEKFFAPQSFCYVNYPTN